MTLSSDPIAFQGHAAFFRRLYLLPWVARLYTRALGRASVAAFSELLERHFLDALAYGANVLEVGCGPALQAIELLRRRPDLRLVASDFSPAFVSRAKENLASVQWAANGCSSGPPTYQVVQADAMDLSLFASGSFEGVYSLTALKHFPDPARGLAELIRVLRPGGQLLLTDFYREASLEDIRGLVNLFGLPTALRGGVARFLHRGMMTDSPSLEQVGAWLGQAGIRLEDADLRNVPALPFFLLLLRKPPSL